MFYTYLLRLSNGGFYAGYSSDLRSRIATHKEGRVLATKGFLPIELVAYFAFSKKINAINFEKYLKSSSGFAFRNKRLI